ncbi:MAG: CinA family protein [Nocardioidaceae bacterium]
MSVEPVGADLARDSLAALRSRGQTLGTAESLTAGLLSASIASVPGASDVLRGAVVSYATDVKTSLLGVPEQVVTEHGVVSAECAEAMATGARRVLAVTWAASTTGVAGPDEQEGHAVGTVYVAVAGPDVVQVQPLALSGSRQQIRDDAVVAALRLLTATCTSGGG